MDTWPYGYDREGRRRIPKFWEEGCYESEYEIGEEQEEQDDINQHREGEGDD